MVRIVKKKGETNETVIRKFNRSSSDENVADDARKYLEYVKPSQVRKEKEKNRNKKRRQTN